MEVGMFYKYMGLERVHMLL